MIRYAVGTVLMFYFLGADVFAPYRPPLLDDGLRAFHHEINRGVWRIVGPSVTYVRQSRSSDAGGWLRKSDQK
jgi:hypothetical protein